MEGSFSAVSKPILQWQVNFAVFFENFKIATPSHRFKHSMYRLSYHFEKISPNFPDVTVAKCEISPKCHQQCFNIIDDRVRG